MGKRLLQKRIMALIMGLILVLAGVLIGASSLHAQENENQLIVGVPVDRCPMFYRDENGEIVGIGVDLMDAAAEEAGFKVTYVELMAARRCRGTISTSRWRWRNLRGYRVGSTFVECFL